MGRNKKSTPRPPDYRPLYALVCAALLLCAWLLTVPRPGIRVTELRPVREPDSRAVARDSDSKKPLRVATYNLEHFTDARRDGPDRTPEAFMAQARGAAEIIAEANPDLLVLQEVENAHALLHLNSLLDQPYPWLFITRLPTTVGDREKLNLALLSRIRPEAVRQLAFAKLPSPGRPTRGTFSAEFFLPPDNHLLVYDLHLKSNFGEDAVNRTKRGFALHAIAADALSEALRNHPAQTATLILGDTNVDPETPQFADDPSLWPLQGGYTDLWLGRPLEERTTIPTRHAGDTNLVFPPSAFDRIFASKNLTEAPFHFGWKPAPPQAMQKGSATNDNTLQPGFGGHVTDHYLTYTDLLPAP